MIVRNQQKNVEIVRTALQGFCLTEVESAVYAAIWNLGPRPAGKIAKCTGFNRSYTYDVLASLEKKGLVQEIEKNRIKHYACTTPEDLLQVLETREREVASQRESLKKSLPDLNRLRLVQQKPPSMRAFHGVDQIANVFGQILSSAEDEICGFLGKDVYTTAERKEYARVREKFSEERVAEEIKYQAIAGPGPGAETLRSEELSEVRVMGSFNMDAEIIVFGERVAVIAVEKEQGAVVLESPILAESLRGIHEALWELLPAA